MATIDDGDEAALDLAVPSAQAIVRSYCPEASEDEGMIVGFVQEHESGRPAAGARVAVGWTSSSRLEAGALVPSAGQRGRREVNLDGASFEVAREEVEVTTDEAGFYRICGIPLGVSLDLVATLGETSERRSFRLNGAPVLSRDLRIDLP